MSQEHDSHPYMSKSQLADYLASLRNNRNNGQPRFKGQESSEESSDGHGSTPLVRALKERYGSGNTTAGYIDVGMSKGRESPTKRALPPVPGKSENSTGWKVGQRNSQDAKRDDKKREEPQERSSSPTKQDDFWTTGVVRPLPAAPKSGSNKSDPRDELRMPLENLSIGSSKSNPPSINAPSVVSAPRVSVPSINAPSINVPSGSSPLDIMTTTCRRLGLMYMSALDLHQPYSVRYVINLSPVVLLQLLALAFILTAFVAINAGPNLYP